MGTGTYLDSVLLACKDRDKFKMCDTIEKVKGTGLVPAHLMACVSTDV